MSAGGFMIGGVLINEKKIARGTLEINAWEPLIWKYTFILLYYGSPIDNKISKLLTGIQGNPFVLSSLFMLTILYTKHFGGNCGCRRDNIG